MSDNEQIEFSKMFSQFKRLKTIKECFYHKKDECRGDIKQSHSIQRNGRLSVIEEEISGNKSIYTFTEFEIGKERFIEKLKPVGKAKASTFFGFCDFHDNKLFSEIENNEFEDSDKHCFLHSYRSFAHSYHRKKEEKKGMEISNPLSDNLGNEFKETWIAGNKMAINDLDFYREKLDKCIEGKKYDDLEYYAVTLPDLFPIACSSLISPFFSISGKSINNHTDPNIPWSPIMLTVLPDFKNTIIIFACFPEDENGVLFLDEISGLNDYQFKKALTSILLHFAENTFLSPLLWKHLGTRGQRIICDEIEKGMRNGLFNAPKKFEYSPINLFENSLTYDILKTNNR